MILHFPNRFINNGLYTESKVKSKASLIPMQPASSFCVPTQQGVHDVDNTLKFGSLSLVTELELLRLPVRNNVLRIPLPSELRGMKDNH